MTEQTAAPVLVNHNPAEAVGYVTVENGELHVRLRADAGVTAENIGRVLGNVGLRILKYEDANGACVIRHAVIAEWSTGAFR